MKKIKQKTRCETSDHLKIFYLLSPGISRKLISGSRQVKTRSVKLVLVHCVGMPAWGQPAVIGSMLIQNIDPWETCRRYENSPKYSRLQKFILWLFNKIKSVQRFVKVLGCLRHEVCGAEEKRLMSVNLQLEINFSLIITQFLS